MNRAKAMVWVAVGVTLMVALIGGSMALWAQYNKAPLIIEDRCQAIVNSHTTTIDPEQARNAAIIAGRSIKRGLIPRAASIALATAYQESGIRNLDYGHADSLGLFQQRPSKGWGTEEQIMDPWYSTTAFYKAMERVPDWETDDINDVAQKVQRSAYPDAYRRHVPNARALASSLTGESPASFSCVVGSPAAADPTGMQSFLIKTLGSKTITTEVSDGALVITTTKAEHAWAVAHLAIANTKDYGLAGATVGPYAWTHSSLTPGEWVGTGPNDTATTVRLEFRAAG